MRVEIRRELTERSATHTDLFTYNACKRNDMAGGGVPGESIRRTRTIPITYSTLHVCSFAHRTPSPRQPRHRYNVTSAAGHSRSPILRALPHQLVAGRRADPELDIARDGANQAARATAHAHTDSAIWSKRLDEYLAACVDDGPVRTEIIGAFHKAREFQYLLHAAQVTI